MRGWITRHITLIVGIAAAGAMLGITVTALIEPEGQFILARQLFGLTALGFLLASCAIGPLVAVFPSLPWKGTLLSGRRAIGVSACIIAIPHVLCYLAPVLFHEWHELFAPGFLWVSGLAVGLLALIDLGMLAWTSRDASVRSLGGKRWKRLHRTVYIAVPLVLLHALVTGTDFGLARYIRRDAPSAEADFGALIIFSAFTVVWLVLVWLRSRGLRWPFHMQAKADNISTANEP